MLSGLNGVRPRGAEVQGERAATVARNRVYMLPAYTLARTRCVRGGVVLQSYNNTRPPLLPSRAWWPSTSLGRTRDLFTTLRSGRGHLTTLFVAERGFFPSGGFRGVTAAVSPGHSLSRKWWKPPDGVRTLDLSHWEPRRRRGPASAWASEKKHASSSYDSLEERSLFFALFGLLNLVCKNYNCENSWIQDVKSNWMLDSVLLYYQNWDSLSGFSGWWSLTLPCVSEIGLNWKTSQNDR